MGTAAVRLLSAAMNRKTGSSQPTQSGDRLAHTAKSEVEQTPGLADLEDCPCHHISKTFLSVVETRCSLSDFLFFQSTQSV